MNLLLDMKGISDDVLHDLSEGGVTSSAKVLRQFTREAAAAINSKEVRGPYPPGKVPCLAHTGDNADFRLYARVLSAIPMGNLLLGYKNAEEVKHLNANYVAGLEPPTEELAREILPTAKDDEVAKRTIMCQNAFALIVAASHAEDAFLNERKPAVNAGSLWSVGDLVSFNHRHVKRTGKVLSVNGNDLRVSYREANGDESIASVTLKDIILEEEEEEDSPRQQREESNETMADNSEYVTFLEGYAVGVDDGGG